MSHKGLVVAALLVCSSILATGSLTTRLERSPLAAVTATSKTPDTLSLGDGDGVELGATTLDGLDAEPRGMASGDFDGDGIDDLLVGYAVPSGGLLAIFRGNVDATHPNAPGAQERRARGEGTDAPFLPEPRVFDLPDAPEHVAAGDFDGDGRMDAVTGAGEILYFSHGDGRGALAAAESLTLAGRVTALASGSMNRPDGVADLVVAVDGPSGAHALTFESPDGAQYATPRDFALPAPATSIAIGRFLTETYGDVALAAGRDLVAIRGHDEIFDDRAPRVETRSFDAEISSVALRRLGSETALALLSADGGLDLLRPDATRNNLASWTRERLATDMAGATGLVCAPVAARPGDTIVAVDAENRSLRLVAGSGDEADKRADASLDVASTPVAVLPMRLNGDAVYDLVVMRRGSVAPSTIVSKTQATYTVTNTNDGGPGSLRQALLNSVGSGDLINFNIPGGGVKTITIDSALPTISHNGLFLDGTSQPGYAGTPLIEINGNNLALDGLTVAAPSVIVQGLTINRCNGAGIKLLALAMNCIVDGCWLGTNNAGTAASPNVFGVFCSGATLCFIGTLGSPTPNVISGNTSIGVLLQSGANVNRVAGNRIGTTASGLAALGNNIGIDLQSQLNIVEGNVVCSNTNVGIGFETSVSNSNTVVNNNVGVGADSATPLPNTNNGIELFSDGGNNTIGNTSGGGNLVVANGASGILANSSSNSITGNTITSNSGAGVYVNGAGNFIKQNAIAGNGGLGIDLAPLGVNANDAGDADSGANNRLNYPVITSASSSSTNTIVTGSLNSTPSGSFEISLYSNTTCDTSGFGEGMTFIGSTVVTTDGGGNATFGVNIAVNTTGKTLTATTKDVGGNTSEFSACSAVTPAADMGITISDAPDPVGPGANVTYTVVVTNAGPGNVTSATLFMPTPPNTTFVSVAQSGTTGWVVMTPTVGSGGSIQGSRPSFASGASTTFTIVLQVNPATAPGTVITANASTSSATADPNGANNNASTSTTVAAQADLGITIADAPDPVTAGNNITYSFTATNAGPSNAANASFSFTLPAGTTYVATGTTAPGWTPITPPIGGTGTVTYSNASFASGAAGNFQIIVKVDPNAASGSTINANVSITSPTTDPTPANNSASTTTTVNTQADPTVVSVTDAPDPVAAGANLTYTVTASNNGPSDAANPTVSMPTPAGTTFVSATPAAGWTPSTPAVGASGTVTFTRASFASGGTATFTVVVKVGGGVGNGSIVTATATIASSTTDNDSTNNSASASTTISAQADLSVGITDAPDPVTAGNNVTYMVTASNAGPSDATNPVVALPVPVGMTFVSASSVAGWNVSAPPVGGTGTVTYTSPSLVAGGSASFQIVFKVQSNVGGGSAFTATATVSASTPDSTPGNNSASTATAVNTLADLSVSISDAPDPASAGTNVTYTVTPQNAGPSDGASASVSLPVPSGTTFVSASSAAGWNLTAPSAGGTGTVTYTRLQFAPTDSAVFQIVVKVGAGVASGSTVTATATISSPTNDPTPANNSASTSTTINAQADLSVTLSDAPDPVTSGTDLTYTITIMNAGPSDAQTVSVAEATPSGTTFVSVSVPGGWSTTAPSAGSTGTVTFSAPSLVAGTSAAFQVVVRVDASVPLGSTISASATVSSATPDSTAGNNTVGATTTVANTADLSVSASAAPAEAMPGEDVAFTITTSNAGPSDAQSVAVTATIPAGASFRSSTAPAGWTSQTPPPLGTGTATFTAASLPAGTSAVFTVVVRVDLNLAAGTMVATNASISSTASDPDGTNSAATATLTVLAIPAADLLVTNVATPTTVEPGETVSYAITALNEGPGAAARMAISDPLPAGVTFVSATASEGGTLTAPASGQTGTVSAAWEAATPAGEARTLIIVVRVGSDAANGAVIQNAASATSQTADFDGTDNSATSVVVVAVAPGTAVADVSLSIADVPDEIDTGDRVAYAITVTNSGPDPAAGVTVSGSTPLGTKLATLSASQGTVSGPAPGASGSFTAIVGDLAAGQSATVTLEVTVVAPGGSILSARFFTSAATNDPSPFDNSVASGETDVRGGTDVLLEWDPPLPCTGDCLNPPLHLQTTNASQAAKGTRSRSDAGRDTRNTVIGYNIYRSNNPNVEPTPENLFSSVPPGTTTLVAPTAPGGSFFTVTAQYPNGESDDTNAASGGIPEPDIATIQIKGNKVNITGINFTDNVVVFVDGIPFKKTAKVSGRTAVLQKGKLLTGQSVRQYLASHGNVILVSVLNTDTGIGTYLYTKQ